MQIKTGSKVTTKDNRTGVVEAVEGKFASVIFPEDNEIIHLEDLSPLPEGPLAQLVENKFKGRHEEFILRVQSLFFKHASEFDPQYGLSNARIEPLPHQIFAAHTALSKQQTRLILADEVGLGKTIEAGLILKELITRGVAQRIVIICPASLQYQWQSELSSKFNEKFEVMDKVASDFFGKQKKNPFEQVDRIITSINYVTREPRQDQLLEAGWDLVIFDEAHRVRRKLDRNKNSVSTKAYQLAEELERLASGILLLTATPMQLHPYEIFSLIEIIEPGLFSSYEHYEKYRTEIPELNRLIKKIEQLGNSLTPQEAEEIELGVKKFLKEENLKSELLLTQASQRASIIDALSEKHPHATVMVRNRKSEIGGFKGREAQQFGVEMSTSEAALYDDVESWIRNRFEQDRKKRKNSSLFLLPTYHKMLASSPAAVYESFKRRITELKKELKDPNQKTRKSKVNREEYLELEDQSDFEPVITEFEIEKIEAEIAELELLNKRIGKSDDCKREKFIEIINNLRKDEPETKIVVFTGFKATQKYLKDNLATEGHGVAEFHGGMNKEEKERQIRDFKTKFPVFISTEAGGEGRNLQFANVIINYDLPWNPMKVEQRIGRLDRYGQKTRVRVLNLFRKETIEQRVHDRLLQRIGLFEESVGPLEPILGDVERDYSALLCSGDTKELEKYEDALEKKVQALHAESLLGDFALDRASFRKDLANKILQKSQLASHDELQDFLTSALRYSGGSPKAHTNESGYIITLSDGLSQKLNISNEPLRGLFDPEDALDRDDLDFFSVGHPFVKAFLDHTSSDDRVKATICRKTPPNLNEDPKLEIIFELQSKGRNSKGKLFLHKVGQDGSIEESEITAIPQFGDSAESEIPEWVIDARARSETKFQSTFETFREEILEADLELRDKDLSRLKRIADYRSTKLEDKKHRLSTQINELERSGDDKQKRIIPALKGQITKTEKILSEQEEKYLHEKSIIENQASTVSAKTWGVYLTI